MRFVREGGRQDNDPARQHWPSARTTTCSTSADLVTGLVHVGDRVERGAT